ncbi:hypothetical protein H845_2764 [Komagataeibacter xylinus E25]|nr:hypothetical protein H845_2764 [Komagataeibacter xylinus E25]
MAALPSRKPLIALDFWYLPISRASPDIGIISVGMIGLLEQTVS